MTKQQSKQKSIEAGILDNALDVIKRIPETVRYLQGRRLKPDNEKITASMIYKGLKMSKPTFYRCLNDIENIPISTAIDFLNILDELKTKIRQ